MTVDKNKLENLKASIANSAESGNYWPAIMVLLIFSSNIIFNKKENLPIIGEAGRK